MLRRTSLLWRSLCGQSEDKKDDDQDQDHHVVSVYQDDDDQYVRVDDPHLDCLHLQGWTSWSRTHFSLRHHLWSFKVRYFAFARYFSTLTCCRSCREGSCGDAVQSPPQA